MAHNENHSLQAYEAGAALAVQPVATSPALVYLSTLGSEGSRRVMGGHLERIARKASGGAHGLRSFPWHMLRHEHTNAIRAELAAGYAPSTATGALAALRGTLRAAYRLELMTLEDMTRAVDLAPVKGDRPAVGRYIEADEVSRLIAQCGQDWGGLREAAMIATLYGGGLRRAELVGLRLRDYDGSGLEVMGKGRKRRRVPLPLFARKHIEAWLELRGDEAGPLFPAAHGGHMRPEAARDLIWRRAKAAGLPRLSMHDFRRSYVSQLLAEGVDLATVARLAGHKSTDTTAAYDRRPDEAAAAAVECLTIPEAT